MKQTSKVYHVELSEPIEVDGNRRSISILAHKLPSTALSPLNS